MKNKHSQIFRISRQSFAKSYIFYDFMGNKVGPKSSVFEILNNQLHLMSWLLLIHSFSVLLWSIFRTRGAIILFFRPSRSTKKQPKRQFSNEKWSARRIDFMLLCYVFLFIYIYVFVSHVKFDRKRCFDLRMLSFFSINKLLPECARSRSDRHYKASSLMGFYVRMILDNIISKSWSTHLGFLLHECFSHWREISPVLSYVNNSY
jgi:hypothetical protein